MSTLRFTSIVLCFVFASAVSGCSTIVAHSEKETPPPFVGTKTAIKKAKKSWYFYDYYGQIFIYVIDTPFSFIADTVLFPIDAYRFERAKPAR